MEAVRLTEKQRKFADYYIASGNAEQSAIRAGYSEAYARGNAHKLVANSCIKIYVEEMNDKLRSERIADMKEIKEFWTETLRNKDIDLRDRLRASEYIAKTNAAFTVKVENVNLNAEMTIEEADEIIAEYESKQKLSSEERNKRIDELLKMRDEKGDQKSTKIS